MSIEKTITIHCPKCSTETATRIWESVNASLDPDEKKALMQGTLNTFQCRGCGLKIFIPVAFMYHDMEKQICVQFYPFDLLDKPDFLDHFRLDGGISKRISRDLDLPPYMRNRHIVFDMGELVRYITFRESLYQHYAGADE